MAVFKFRRFSSVNLFLLLFGHFCSRRRAMVNKLWCRDLLSKWFQSEHVPPPARCFSEPNWQNQLSCWYLVYRWLIYATWQSIVICSILEVGSVEVLGDKQKWAIYLTNWDLALGLTQALLGALLVTKRWRQQRSQDGPFDPCQLNLGIFEKIYWFLFVATSSLAIGVTVTYWSLVHDPTLHHVDPLNILVHVSNSLLMLLDLCVTGVPFELRFFWWCPILVCLYLLFTLVYWAAGGLDRRGRHKIYGILDWELPGRTLLFCSGGIIFLMITHCLLYLLARLRDRASATEGRRKTDSCV